MTPSVIAGAARRADHERPRQGHAADIGRGARILLYTSSDCWRGAGISYIEIASGLEGCGFVPRILATNPVVAAEFNAAGLRATCVSGERGESMRRAAVQVRGTSDSNVHQRDVQAYMAAAGSKERLLLGEYRSRRRS